MKIIPHIFKQIKNQRFKKRWFYKTNDHKREPRHPPVLRTANVPVHSLTAGGGGLRRNPEAPSAKPREAVRG